MPECTDCGDPAATQIKTGAIRTSSGWRRVVEWLCESCAREAEAERRWARGK